MAWYWWVLIWAVLIIGSAGVFFLLGRSLWRRTKAFGHELTQATDRLAAVTEALSESTERPASEPAVFTDPTHLRQQRILAARRRDGKHSANLVKRPPVRPSREPQQRVR